MVTVAVPKGGPGKEGLPVLPQVDSLSEIGAAGREGAVADTLNVYAAILYRGGVARAGAADVFVGTAGRIAGGSGVN